MKKLALLLAALGVVSAAAYAAPELTVTNFGQSIETENKSNNTYDIDDIWLWNTVGLKYDDWSFSLTAGKHWSGNYDHEKEIKSTNHRLQFDVSKPVTDNLKLSARYRGQNNYDRFQLGYSYANGMFLSSGDIFYDSKNGAYGHDEFHAELFPVGVKLGAVTLKYYFEYVEDLGGRDEGKRENYTEHQIRLYAPLYNGERLSLSTEGRFTITQDEDYNGKVDYRHFDDFGRNRLYLKANYAVSENLDVFGTVGYEMREWKLENNKTDDHTEKYWSNVVIGYNYKF